MATSIRRLTRLEAEQAIAVQNALRLDLLKLRAGSIFHADATTGVSLEDLTAGSSTADQVAFTLACSAAYTAHIASACAAATGQGAHLAADATNVLTTPNPTDLASCNARMNEIKAQYNLHRASTTFHPVADSTNTMAASDATNAATLATLGNQVKARLNAHFAAAFTHQATLLVSP
ncbi:hypothetical protein BE20_24935 [Sorangium cellulosum]|uniref:Uncharacterized protein n=1 Tax=Sorangium cellulosum TaxID=56 RepID=A0A150S5Q9_SORCE|nr:hypothetical protein BE20_24935 [Sorangium cellulosum]KYF89272.1 hypothetical protein BE18_22835 [Sorangium cellulosum]